VSDHEDCLFCRIVAADIPADVVLDTANTLAFRDIAPAAPAHVLVIPKQHYPNMAATVAADPGVAGEIIAAAVEVARLEGLEAAGYRLVANTGAAAGQTVFHAHLHVLGGRGLSWPPG
jgi:histidine triad (HIT) family protein